MAFKNGVKVEVTIDINNIENKVTESDKKLIDNKLKADEKLMLIYVHNKTINVSFTENFTLI
ncbi:MAG: hypothetical protein ACLU90_08745 [Lachnospira sp.]|nr:hypothetical protein [Eubacterium sp.]